jgi:hypothetical protein
LWSAAAELARKDGVNRTAAELHLDGGKLKRLMGAKTTSGKSAQRSWNFSLLGQALFRNARLNWKGVMARYESS